MLTRAAASQHPTCRQRAVNTDQPRSLSAPTTSTRSLTTHRAQSSTRGLTRDHCQPSEQPAPRTIPCGRACPTAAASTCSASRCSAPTARNPSAGSADWMPSRNVPGVPRPTTEALSVDIGLGSANDDDAAASLGRGRWTGVRGGVPRRGRDPYRLRPAASSGQLAGPE